MSALPVALLASPSPLAQALAVEHLSSLDQQLAIRLCRLVGCESPDAALLLALTSAALGQGHVCLPLSALDQLWPPPAEDPESDSGGGDWLASLRARSLSERAALMTDHGLAGSALELRPLVLEGGRLYFRRYYEHEVAVAEHVRMRQALSYEGDGRSGAALSRLFPSAQGPGVDLGQMRLDHVGLAEPDGQREAAKVCMERGLAVISGGPGTGKTSTVVKILALLVEQALDRGVAPPRIALLAPTGKAAARLSEAIAGARDKLDVTEQVRQAIHAEATTIHRALGMRAGGLLERHPGRPLEADVVLVDEGSMIDLGLMRRLLDAVPHDARLILLGDRDQLASVEAGAVLGDLCGGNLGKALRGHHPLARCIVQLDKSYRYSAHSGIGRLASAIRQGKPKEALELLHSARDLVLKPALRGGLGDAAPELLTHYQPYLKSKDAQSAHTQFNRFRVLCAHRRGEGGVTWLNQQIELLLLRNRYIRRDGPFYRGRPIMVTRNDPTTHLYNGDIGLLWSGAASRPARAGLAVTFAQGDGGLRALSPSRLPQHESVYAMTVHKSQGTEFDRVLIVLPTKITPLLCRELLYTAVTRARRHVTIYGDADVIRAAIEQPVQRLSGLSARLWG